MATLFVILYYLLFLFMLMLLARLVFDYVFMFARSWKPNRPVVMLLEVIYSVTDPPLKLLRRFIPPIRVGGVALDVGFFILFITVILLMNVVQRIAISFV